MHHLLLTTCFLLPCFLFSQANANLFPPDTPRLVNLWHRVGDFSQRMRSVEACEISPDGRYVVSGAKFGYEVMLWRVADGSLVWENAHESEVECVTWSPDGKRIATGGEDFTVRIWDTQTGAQLHVIEVETSGFDGIAWSPDGKYIVGGDEEGYAVFFDGETYQQVKKIKVGSTINSLHFTADGKRLLVGGNIQTPDPEGPGGKRYEGFAKVLDVASGEVVLDVGKQAGSIKSVRYSPDETVFATGGFDNKARLFAAADGKLLREFENPLKIEAVRFSPDGHFLLTGGHDHAINFYRMRDGELALRLPSARVEYLDFSRDGRLLATGHEDSGLVSLYLLLTDTQAAGNYHELAREQLNNRDMKKQ